MESIYLLFVAGALGAFLKEIINDNELKLPCIRNGIINLGFIGGIIIGAFAGYAIDGSYLTAMMGGFSGTAVIQALVQRKTLEEKIKDEAIEDKIRRIATEELVDPDLAIRVALCESSLQVGAKNTNTDGSIDRGLYQINSKWHPEVTADQAFDADFSIRFFCKAFKAGHLDWWNASKPCWGLTK